MNLDYISTLLSYMITIIISSWTLYTYYNTPATDKDSVSKLYDLMIISYIFLIVSIFIIVLLTTQNIGNTTMYFVLSILLVLTQTTYTIYQVLNIDKKIEKDKLYNFLLTNILFLSLISIIFMYKSITYFNTKNTTQQYGQQSQYTQSQYGQQSPYYQQPYYGQQQPYYYQQQTPPPQVIVVQTPPSAAPPLTKT